MKSRTTILATLLGVAIVLVQLLNEYSVNCNELVLKTDGKKGRGSLIIMGKKCVPTLIKRGGKKGKDIVIVGNNQGCGDHGGGGYGDHGGGHGDGHAQYIPIPIPYHKEYSHHQPVHYAPEVKHEYVYHTPIYGGTYYDHSGYGDHGGYGGGHGYDMSGYGGHGGYGHGGGGYDDHGLSHSDVSGGYGGAGHMMGMPSGYGGAGDFGGFSGGQELGSYFRRR